MKFQFYRFSLVETKEISLFANRERSKTEIFKEILDLHFKNHSFKHGKSQLGVLIRESLDDYIFASLGRRATSKITHSPEENFNEEVQENWYNCDFFINLKSTEQTIAMQYKSFVFEQPINQLKAFAQQVNKYLLNESYELVIIPIFVEQKFWDVVNKNIDKIEELKLKFIAPNVLNLHSNLNDGLRELKKDFAITDTTVSLKNNLGGLKIPENSSFINQSLEYASKGAGEVILKSKKKTTLFRSGDNKNIKSKEIVQEIELKGLKINDLKRIIHQIFHD